MRLPCSTVLPISFAFLCAQFDASSALARDACRVACWLNTEERQLFYRPFEGAEAEGCVRKMQHFLPIFEKYLRFPTAVPDKQSAEFARVLEASELLRAATPPPQPVGNLGYVIVRAPKAVHYYALFGRAADCAPTADVAPVLGIGPGLP